MTFAALAPPLRIVQALVLLTLGLCLTACDPHRAERAEAQTLLNQLQAELAHQQRLLEQAQADLARTASTQAELQGKASELKATQASRSARLAEYLTEHKAAAVALVATGAGAVTALDDDTRQSVQRELGQEAAGMAMAAGLLGAGYCLFNAEECASVAGTLAAYGVERQATTEQRQQVEAALQELASTRNRQQQALDASAAALHVKEARVGEAQARVASLACKGPFCGN